MQQPIVLVIGTRAEAIKLIPLYLALQQEKLNVLLCATFQHSDLLEQACTMFNVIPDFNLNIMRQNQDLFYLTQSILEKQRRSLSKQNLHSSSYMAIPPPPWHQPLLHFIYKSLLLILKLDYARVIYMHHFLKR
jgi:UDP-N-acetylglucosamine 2-epimerase